MIEPDWRSRNPAAESVERLVDRIDWLRALVEDGRFEEVRAQVWGERWRRRIAPAGVPATVMHRAQEWVDVAFECLQEPYVDPASASNALLQARRAISG